MKIRDITLKQKYQFGTVIILIVCMAMMIGLRFMGKGAYFIGAERGHFEYVSEIEKSILRAATSDIATPKSQLLRSATGARTIAITANNSVFEIEKMLFRAMGFSAIFEIIENDIADLGRIQQTIVASPDEAITPMLADAISTDLGMVFNNSKIFGPLVGEAVTFIIRFVLILNIIGVALIVATIVVLWRSTLLPLKQASIICEDISSGDLSGSIKVSSRDEIGQLMQSLAHMSEKLGEIVAQVQGASEIIGTGSQQISSGNDHLSHRTEEQAASLEETTASMGEMTSTVKQNAESAQRANQLTTEAQSQIATSAKVIQQTIAAMGEINESSAQIADINTAIDGIAFQTNLLALNAAVEAARAGEHGRGFAVVASEVRVLAQRSATAAREIKGLIENSLSKIHTGTELADKSGRNLEEIISSVGKVADTVTEITDSSRKQSGGIEQVNSTITQISGITQENAALVEEVAASSRTMQGHADNLSSLMEFFRLKR